MDYNKLKTFVVVADNQSITIAAKKLYRTQPAISMQIKELEDDLGITLFHREKGKVFLTKAGSNLFEIAKQTFKGLDGLIHELTEDPNRVEGTLKIGAVPEYGREVLTRNLARFKELYPLVHLEVIFRPSESLVERLKQNDIDIALATRVSNKRNLKIKKITKINTKLVTSPAYKRAHGTIQKKKLLEYELVDFRDDFTLFAPWMIKNTKAQIMSLKHDIPDVTIEDFRAIRNYVISGRGLAVLPLPTIAEDLKTGRLIEVFKGASPVEIPIYAVSKQSRETNLLQNYFLEFMQNLTK